MFANDSFVHGKFVAFRIQLLILSRKLLPKLLISRARFPTIHRYVNSRGTHIAQEPSPAIPRIPLEQPRPLAIRSICTLKQFFASRLDFEFPQSYKHCCPIFCSWMLAVPSEPEIVGKYPLPRQV